MAGHRRGAARWGVWGERHEPSLDPLDALLGGDVQVDDHVGLFLLYDVWSRSLLLTRSLCAVHNRTFTVP